MLEFQSLGPLMENLHQDFVRLYYLLLPVFFTLAVTLQWFKSGRGSFDFLDTLKRAVISTLLLVALPDISKAILLVADGIAERIDSVNSLDNILKLAQERAESYSLSTKSLLLQFNNLLIAVLSFISYLVLYVARYLMIAMYYFFWMFFVTSAPLLLLFNLFPSTSRITVNLFRGMIEVASWKIVWAILGVMLSALSFGDAYRIEGNYLTLMVMNFVIAISMLMTPLIVRNLVGQGIQSVSNSLGAMTFATMAGLPGRVVNMANTGRNMVRTGYQTSQSAFKSGRQFMNSKTNPLRTPARTPGNSKTYNNNKTFTRKGGNRKW